MQLYSYFRSSAAYRVRIALNLKGLPYDIIPIHLLRDGGQQLAPEYLRVNPAALVPTLRDNVQEQGGSGARGEVLLTQSLAIIEYLDEAYPEPSLLPGSPQERAYVRSIALSIACEIHPLNNLRVLRYLTSRLGVSENEKNAWYRHWCEQGLAAVESMLVREGRAGKFCHGDTPTLADCVLVPQIFNAQRLNCDLSAMPIIMRINEACLALEAFGKAAPAQQPDAE